MLIRILAGVAVALCAAAPLTAKERVLEKPVRAKSRCIGDRCAIYVNGRRVGSYKEEYGRIIVRDKKGRRVLTVTQEDDDE